MRAKWAGKYVAGTREGHVKAKSAGDEVAVSREGSCGCKWDTLSF